MEQKNTIVLLFGNVFTPFHLNTCNKATKCMKNLCFFAQCAIQSLLQHASTCRERRMELEKDEKAIREPLDDLDSGQLIVPGTPIQFDIVLPPSEFLDHNRGSRRTNPFGESEDQKIPDEDGSLLQQMFLVNFLGSMAVKSDASIKVIYEAMRQVLAARAIHNIFRTTESHLMVTSKTLRLIDPQTQVTRVCFQLENITQFIAHQDNKRLIGFVVRDPDFYEEENSFSAYVLESNTDGEKICYAINLGKELTQAQKNPDALAQLMMSIPLTNDGKFMLLNNHMEDKDSTNEGAEAVESEA